MNRFVCFATKEPIALDKETARRINLMKLNVKDRAKQNGHKVIRFDHSVIDYGTHLLKRIGTDPTFGETRCRICWASAFVAADFEEPVLHGLQVECMGDSNLTMRIFSAMRLATLRFLRVLRGVDPEGSGKKLKGIVR